MAKYTEQRRQAERATIGVPPQITRALYKRLKKEAKEKTRGHVHKMVPSRAPYRDGFGSRARRRGQQYGPKG